MNPLINKRVVAIVGRPNVGKSSIFNRLMSKRIAIVHQASGVTRDRLIRETLWNGQRFDLVDTGGLGKLDSLYGQDSAQLEAEVKHQVQAAIQDAAAIIFVTDIRTGLLPHDEELGRFLRKSGRPIFLAVNKADNPTHVTYASEFNKLGFTVFPVSALHNYGFDNLMDAVLEILPQIENVTIKNPLRVTIVGHPNVGKSSIINKLLRHDRLITTPTAGTTRDSIDIPFIIGRDSAARHYVLTDTAGMRHHGKLRCPVEELSLMRAQKSIAGTDVAVLVLDAIQGPTLQDKKIAARILDHHKGFVLLVNKWDLVEAPSATVYEKHLRRVLAFIAFAPIIFCSAKTGYNFRRIIDAIDHVAAQTRTQLPTGILNRTLIKAQERTQPPMIKGKRFRIYYATQLDIQPVTLALFVNDPARMPPAYKNYLIATLRQAFGLEGAPIILQLKPRHAYRKGHAAA